MQSSLSLFVVIAKRILAMPFGELANRYENRRCGIHWLIGIDRIANDFEKSISLTSSRLKINDEKFDLFFFFVCFRCGSCASLWAKLKLTMNRFWWFKCECLFYWIRCWIEYYWINQWRFLVVMPPAPAIVGKYPHLCFVACQAPAFRNGIQPKIEMPFWNIQSTCSALTLMGFQVAVWMVGGSRVGAFSYSSIIDGHSPGFTGVDPVEMADVFGKSSHSIDYVIPFQSTGPIPLKVAWKSLGKFVFEICVWFQIRLLFQSFYDPPWRIVRLSVCSAPVAFACANLSIFLVIRATRKTVHNWWPFRKQSLKLTTNRLDQPTLCFTHGKHSPSSLLSQCACYLRRSLQHRKQRFVEHWIGPHSCFGFRIAASTTCGICLSEAEKPNWLTLSRNHIIVVRHTHCRTHFRIGTLFSLFLSLGVCVCACVAVCGAVPPKKKHWIELKNILWFRYAIIPTLADIEALRCVIARNNKTNWKWTKPKQKRKAAKTKETKREKNRK